jgi:hypothetical protein
MTLYDKLNWHEGEHGFTHIGFFLAWLIRRDLHDPAWFSEDHVELVKRGEMTGSDLSDSIDTKLVSHVMSSEGKAFSDARYGAYVEEYARLFADYPDYGVADEPATYPRAEEMLDGLYASWVAAGRPPADSGRGEGTPAAMTSIGFTIMTPPGYSEEGWAEVVRRAEADESFEPPPQDERFMRHAAPDLEQLVPRDLTSPPIALSSTSASDWGSSLLNRSLKRLGVKPKDAIVVSGVGGRGEDAVMVALYAIPGASSDALDAELATGLGRPPGGRWTRREIDSVSINWAEGSGLAAAYWVVRGLVYHVGASNAATLWIVERLVALSVLT